MAFDILLFDDDEEEAVAGVREALGGEDFSIRAVRSGVEAFTAVMESRPDAIVADVGVRGEETRKLYQVLRHLASARMIPFLFLGSAGDSPGPAAGELSLPADDFLEKPFLASDLREKIDLLREALDRGGAEEPKRPLEDATCNVTEVLVDTIEFLVAVGRTGTLTVSGDGGEGRIFIDKGVPRHASFERLDGEFALLRLLKLEKVEVSFKEGSNEALVFNLNIDWKIFASTHC